MVRHDITPDSLRDRKTLLASFDRLRREVDQSEIVNLSHPGRTR